MRARSLLLAALVAGGLAACGGGGTDPWTLEVTGTVRLDRDGAVERLREGSHQVEEGDRLEVVDGAAVLTLPDDASLELRAGRSDGSGRRRIADSALLVADEPELLAGEMLLVGGDDAARAVAGAATVSIADGALRVRRGSSVTVGVYAGTPTLEASGQELEDLTAYRQATVTDSGALPRQLQPVTYDRRDLDPWDRRFLGPAVDLDRRIEPLQAAVAQNAERDQMGSVVLAIAGAVPIDPSLSVGEAVVGAAIARAGTAGDDVATRWRQVFSFRDDGASWGLVALDQEADRGQVLSQLADVVRGLDQRFGGVAAGRGGSNDVAIAPRLGDGIGGGSGRRQPGTGGGDEPGDGGDGGDGGDTPPTTPPPTVPPTTPPPTTPPLLPLPDVPIDPAPEPEPEPSSTPTVVDQVDETVEPVPIIGGVVDGMLGDSGTTGGGATTEPVVDVGVGG